MDMAALCVSASAGSDLRRFWPAGMRGDSGLVEVICCCCCCATEVMAATAAAAAAAVALSVTEWLKGPHWKNGWFAKAASVEVATLDCELSHAVLDCCCCCDSCCA